MKSIKLTEEHKAKLLDMCKKLFPDYDFTLDKWEQCFVTLGLKSKVTYDSHIHWFEFCMTYLAEKIIDNTENSKDYCDGIQLTNYEFQITNFSFKSKHLVDYLYEEFKKLKL